MPHALLVDDDANFVMGLSEVVAREGFTTKTAATLKEARAELAKGTPDVVLVDLHLPDGLGLEVAQWMRTSPPVANVPVVIVSADSTQAQTKRCFIQNVRNDRNEHEYDDRCYIQPIVEKIRQLNIFGKLRRRTRGVIN